jgi:hypothetical protein
MKGKLLYEETHGFKGTWTWYLVLLITVGMSGQFMWGLYVQFVNETPWGNNPMSDTGLLLTSILTILFMIGTVIFIGMNVLTLKIDEGTIYVRYQPFFGQKEYRIDEFQKMYVRKYKPILEYGGWGFRSALRKNKAYNITGNWGLQLVFKDGKKLLIGTRNPKKLEQVISQLNVRNG